MTTQKFENNLFQLEVKTENGESLFDVETVAKSLGISRIATSGNEVVRWERVNKYLGESYPQVGTGDFISEPMVYKLAFKANNALAEKFQDWLAVEVLPQIRETGSYKSTSQATPTDVETKRMNAEARLRNAKVREAQLLVELAKDTTSLVNKALLQDKAVEVLDGKKLLEMPTLRQHLYDSDQIAKKVGVFSKKGKPHGTAVSQLIKREIFIEEGESEIVPEATNHWGGTVTKYSESVIEKVTAWLEAHDYPAKIKGNSMDYHVQYEF